MRRLIGVVALVALIFGAWWLVQNGYDMTRITGDMTTAEDSSTPGDAGQTTEKPAETAETPAASDDAATDPKTSPEAAESASSEAGAAPPADEAESADAESTAEEPPVAGDVPTFDIVRVEPSGETVIAGLAAPNTTVEVLDGPEAVATAEANERGEWALVLEKPLPPGTHDLAIRTTSPDKSTVTLSDQRVAVAVPENANEEPLVVLSTPEAPSSVMQAPAGADVATAPPTGPAGSETAPAIAAAPESSAKSGSPSSAPAESEIAAAPPSEPTSPSGAQAPGEPTIAGSSGEPTTPPAVAKPESDVAITEPKAGAETSETSPAAPGDELAASASGEPSSPEAGSEGQVTTPAVEEAPAPAKPQVGVAAVEAETDGALFVAGTATTKDPVRVYIDDELIGETNPTEGGTWLLETKRDVAPGDYTIRADQVEAATGEVIVRAEVPFEREIAVAVLKQTGEGGDNGAAEMSGSIAGPMTVIIKRGDNLWRISRELYGNGIRYSTIYQANRDQIRNPDRIYPGQVFVLPAGDTAWQN